MTIKCNDEKEYECQREKEFIENKNNKTDKFVKEHECSKCKGNHLTRWCNYPKKLNVAPCSLKPTFIFLIQIVFIDLSMSFGSNCDCN